MHEKIKNLSELVDKLIELNFKVKTENKSLKGKITEPVSYTHLRAHET